MTFNELGEILACVELQQQTSDPSDNLPRCDFHQFNLKQESEISIAAAGRPGLAALTAV